MDDDWPNCDAEAVVAALSVRYRFSRANAVQLLRDQGILRPRAEAEQDDDDDVEEAEGWGSEEDEEEEEDEEGQAAIIPMPGQGLVSVGAMVVGTGEGGFQDGAAAAVMFNNVRTMLHLPDGRVLVTDGDNHRVRVLSADLQQVSTLTNVDEVNDFSALELLPDGRLLVGGNKSSIRVLEGFPAALLGPKPSYKRPKKTNQQQQKEKKKRALAGGASSSGRLLPKRSRSGASSSSMTAAPSSSDSEGEEQQPGGSAAEAEPLV